MIDLLNAFRLGPTPRLALVGAGGKTSVLFSLARAYTRAGVSPILTATTHLATSQLGLADRHFVVTDRAEVAAIAKDLASGVTLITGPDAGAGRVSGLDAGTLAGVLALADQRRVPLLVEADGSRRRPLKAPADHEPAIPAFADQVLVVAGLSGLGKPLDRAHVHRPERFSALSGIGIGAVVTPQALVRVVAHPHGGLKNIPPGARRVVLLAQATTADCRAQAKELAEALIPPFQAVVVADVSQPGGVPPEQSWQAGGEEVPARVYAVYEPIAGIVLAAGESSRFGGSPKQLLDWQGEPMVRVVAQTALAAGLSPVVVVTGAFAGSVEPVLTDLPVTLVRNRRWREGQSASVKAAVGVLPPDTGAALFLLADQPQIPPTLVRALVDRHRQTLSPIVAPLIDGRRGNPALFDRVTFPDLLALQGDTGGRPLFARYPVTWVTWHDPGLANDVDTPEDYRRLLDRENPA